MQNKIENNELYDLYKTIGSNVKYYREKAGISQLELATRLGYLSQSVISNNEINYSGKYHFSIKQLYLISKELKVPIEKFFKCK